MDFSVKYFGKPLDDLSYEDICTYFEEEKEESDLIEFKSYNKKYGNFNNNLEGVIRGICALVNSGGGILIWGAPEGEVRQGSKEKIFKGSLSPVDEVMDKDRLISKISDSIVPLPIGIKVQILQSENDCVYVFEAEVSSYRPHQYKNTYFARLDGQTKPAPHYLIEALFRQIKYPNIEGYIKLESIGNDGYNFLLDMSMVFFNFSPLQNEENLFFSLACPQGKIVKSKNVVDGEIYLMGERQLVFENYVKILHFGAPRIETKRIMFNVSELLKYNYIVDIILSFGGKNSPLKSSQYKLDLSHINWSDTKAPNYLLVSSEENMLAVEKQKQVGSSREHLLKIFLDRE